MNIVVFNQYAGSQYYGMEYRTYFLAKYWAQWGHNVTIVASSFSHLRIFQPRLKPLHIYTTEKIDGIEYKWVYGNKYKGNGFKRALNIILYSCLSFFFSLTIKKCDCIITSSTHPLDIFSALWLKKKFPNSKFIYEPHDLWPMALCELGGMSKIHPFVLLMQYGENLSCKHAQYIVSMHPNNIDYLETKGCRRKNFFHIPNGVEVDSWDTGQVYVSSGMRQIQELKNSGYKVIMYTGSISTANGLGGLLEVAKLLKDKKIVFVLFGAGSEVDDIVKEINFYQLNILYLGKVEKKFIPYILRSADICYLSFKYNPMYRFGMSANKLWDYMMSAKPILMVINSSNDPVGDAGCGITVSSGLPWDIANGLKKLLSYDGEKLRKMGEKGALYVRKNNDYKKLALDFMSILTM